MNYITKYEKNFKSLVLNPYGRSVDFQWAEGKHNILYVELDWSFLVSLFLESLKLLLNYPELN